MGRATRHALAILLLPGTVAVLVPLLIARFAGTELGLPESWPGWSAWGTGLLVLGFGVGLFTASLRRLGGEGRGTLAPWDPPERLVVRGPYAHVRNPLISGVVLVLLGEGLLLRSVAHLGWAGLFFLANAAYIPRVEEPALGAKFGEAYEEYARNVPRLIPRIRPWRRGNADADPGGPPP
ncbi:MAG: isoprenylcysteine carboxylmethyltransferase family protein [Gammaproteobacteria bacterium]|nr:isoprenylcysteine carboxylmethyltransferase family protein [Gemmatimonadota bacterium]NIT89443.1 isoprenylcysteine carboxylmethyltransferase family protein [Gemmatimonadota bacterium]NIU75921.1 isoprenylcysteine carboxylmethyltransferase family protein [Gammaproteobacteria bacterium]NIX41575.1 isoprenylcysteine carboxylmethyltransferase family protein [Gemmatimonadota bacterium]